MIILKKQYINILIIAVILILGYLIYTGYINQNNNEEAADEPIEEREEVEIMPNYKASRFKEIYLAGGCFWGVEAYFDKILGIEYTEVGYANGDTDDTNYQRITSTGHAETVKVIYDDETVKLEEILDYYFKIIDPTILNRQGNDVGTQYRTGIYYVDEKDEENIKNYINSIKDDYDKAIVTEAEPLKNFVTGEDYHQDYLEKNPNGYCHINLSDIPNRKPEIDSDDYPKPSEEKIKEMLTEEQYKITQGKGTEPPFKNQYYNDKRKGLYVDIITGEPLFSSRDKYESGSGWPSFTKPIDIEVVIYEKDFSLGMNRIEVLSRSGKTHLGHVFNDGPRNEGGLRFCINSGSLRFIPLEEMEEEGYGAYKVYIE